jgi:hypothetical protein
VVVDGSGVSDRKKERADPRLATMNGGEAGKQSKKNILGYRFGIINSASGEIPHNRWRRATVQGFEGFTIRCPVRVQDAFTGGLLLTFRCT